GARTEDPRPRVFAPPPRLVDSAQTRAGLFADRLYRRDSKQLLAISALSRSIGGNCFLTVGGSRIFGPCPGRVSLLSAFSGLGKIRPRTAGNRSLYPAPRLPLHGGQPRQRARRGAPRTKREAPPHRGAPHRSQPPGALGARGRAPFR